MNPSSKSFPRSIDKGVVMKKEKNESALEEHYAPPTSSDETSSESAAERWSVGLVMDVVLIIATILASTSWILLARFADHNPLNLPSATIETLDAIVKCLYNVLRYLGGVIPLVAVPVRIIVFIATVRRGTALRVEWWTFWTYVAVVGLIWVNPVV